MKTRYRNASFEVRAEEGAAEGEGHVRVSISSETPCPMEVRDPDTGAWTLGMEILGHTEAEIDRSRSADGLVVQDTHNGDQIGLIRDLELADGKLGGEIEFCCGHRAQEIRADALKGLRRNMSVGYLVAEWKRTGEEIDGLPVYRAVRWTPFEASFVNVPADVQVGVNREALIDDETEAAKAAAKTKEAEMADEVKEPQAAEPAVADQIAALAEKVDAIAAKLNEPPKEEKPEMPTAEAKTMFTPAETAKAVRRYNLMNAVRAMVGVRGVDAGFEREISDEIAHQTGRSARGMFIPEFALTRAAWGKDNGGANLVATDTLFGEMVPALVAETVLGKLGARTLSGLVGDVDIPKASAATAYWVSAEGGDSTETTPSIGQVSATPKTIGCYCDITRKLLNQSGISAQAFVTDALRSAIARGIETAAFSGAGTSGAPTGIDATTGVTEITDFTAPTLAKLLSFVSTIEGDNAAGADMKFAGRPGVWATLGSTLDWKAVTDPSAGVTGGVTSGKYLLDTATNTCQGYPFVKANLAKADRLYFGDWSRLLLAFWAGLDVTVDTNTLSKSGGVRIVALQDMDVIVTQPKAFAYGDLA